MNAYYEWAQFGEDVDFKKANFNKESHFLETQFSGIAHFDSIHSGGFQDFRNARFKDLAYFEGTNFSGDSYFDGVQFLRDVDFRMIKLGGFADFSETKFNANIDFRGTEFLHDAIFSNTQFMSETYFSDAKFNNYAEFMGSKFGGNAYFWNAQFKGDADFWNVQFDKRTDFTGATFGRNANFDGSQFSDSRNSLTTFSKVSFNGNTSFAEAQLSPIFDFRYSNFNNSLNLTRLAFDRLEIRWNDIEDKLICDESVYVSLVKNFENLGQFEDADNCFFQYRSNRQEHSEFGLSRFIDTMAGITCGYGVRPQYIAVWSIFLILVFSAFFYQARAIKKSEPNLHAIVRPRRYNKNNRDPTFWDALHFSILVFFVSLPPQEWRAIERWRFLVMLEDLLGWLFITLFVVVLGHIMIR